jgi:hypothetical protein
MDDGATAASNTVKFKNSMRTDASNAPYNNSQFYRNNSENSNNEIEKTRQEAETARQEAELKYKAEQAQLDRDNDVRVAEIRSAGYSGTQDFNENKQSDYIDTLDFLDIRRAKDRDQTIAETRETNRLIENQTSNDLKRQEIQSRKEIADKQLHIALANKNKYDVKK